jgi:hypothetical protein
MSDQTSVYSFKRVYVVPFQIPYNLLSSMNLFQSKRSHHQSNSDVLKVTQSHTPLSICSDCNVSLRYLAQMSFFAKSFANVLQLYVLWL